MLRAELAGGCADGVPFVRAHAQRAGALENARAVTVDGGGQAMHIADRLQLQLVVKTDGAVRPVRQIDTLGQRHR